MRILLVVHGFPPAAQSGCEIYAHAHAVAMRRTYGDEILVLTREADTGRDEYAVRFDRRDGLAIASINNTFRRVRGFEDSYRNETIGAIAAAAIDDFRPDVAHIHHLTCLSTTIVRALAERGIPSVLTLHDYWLICHRGQLLDADYQICDGPEPDGCHACLGSAAGRGRVAWMGAAALRNMRRIRASFEMTSVGPGLQARPQEGRLIF
jgi:glycosyltransferase involved in cell wall biosynthesis